MMVIDLQHVHLNPDAWSTGRKIQIHLKQHAFFDPRIFRLVFIVRNIKYMFA